MSRYDENASRASFQNNPTTPEPSTDPKLPPLPRPSGNIRLRKKRTSSQTSSYASDQELPLYIASTRNQRQQRQQRQSRQSRQSLSAISNRSVPSNDDTEISYILASSLSQERLAWKIINKEIAEWQNVCHTGRPSWWSPESRWIRRLRSQSSLNRDMSNFASKGWADEMKDSYYPGLCFGQERRAGPNSYKEGRSKAQEMAFLIAVQLLGACFTLPAEQFASYKTSTSFCFAFLDSNGIPDSRLISSLRMHTDYRWSPAFGHEARSTSPEYIFQAIHGGASPLTTSGQVSNSPEVEDSSKAPKKRKNHRARYVTPADTSRQESYGDSSTGKAFPTLPTPNLYSWREAIRGTKMKIKSLSIPGRRVRSCPPSPWQTAASLETHTYRSEYPFPIQPEDYESSGEPRRSGHRLEWSRYSLQPTIQSEPHPVFVQPVKELIVKRWRAFRCRFGYSLSHGCPDPGSTSASFIEEYTSSSWSPLGGPSINPEAVKRRRDARQRHDIHSSSMESSPRYNTPTSGTASGTSSPICVDPSATSPAAGEFDNSVESMHAITGISLSVLQEPNAAGQLFPAFTPNNNPDGDSEISSPGLIPRNDAGFFTNTAGITRPGHGTPSFVPRRGNSRRAARRSMLSEVYTPDDVQELALMNLHLVEVGGSTLTTPTEESESDASAKRALARKLLGAGPESNKLQKCRSLQTLTRRKTSPELSISFISTAYDAHAAVDCKSREFFTEPPLQRAQSPLSNVEISHGVPHHDDDFKIETGRSRLKRMSSNGTTLFVPSDDGVEVDGLPTGPRADMWDGEDRRGKRRVRSFL